MTYYKAIPLWKDNSRQRNSEFVGDDKIVYSCFDSLEAALCVAKEDGTLLRPTNWEFSKHSGFLGWHKTIIPLEWMRQNGYLSNEIDQDSVGVIYKFK